MSTMHSTRMTPLRSIVRSHHQVRGDYRRIPYGASGGRWAYDDDYFYAYGGLGLSKTSRLTGETVATAPTHHYGANPACLCILDEYLYTVEILSSTIVRYNKSDLTYNSEESYSYTSFDEHGFPVVHVPYITNLTSDGKKIIGWGHFYTIIVQKNLTSWSHLSPTTGPHNIRHIAPYRSEDESYRYLAWLNDEEEPGITSLLIYGSNIHLLHRKDYGSNGPFVTAYATKEYIIVATSDPQFPAPITYVSKIHLYDKNFNLINKVTLDMDNEFARSLLYVKYPYIYINLNVVGKSVRMTIPDLSISYYNYSSPFITSYISFISSGYPEDINDDIYANNQGLIQRIVGW